MKRVLSTVVIVALAVAAPAQAAPGNVTVAEGKRVYLVQPGDTLSGIAGEVLGDPGRWREIWKANPQIRKPGLIFPGDTLVLGDAPAEEEADLGVRAKAPSEVAAVPSPPRVIAPGEFLEGAREEAFAGPVLKPVPTTEAPGIPPAAFDRCGFIADTLPEAAIIGSPDGKGSLTTFDSLFIDRGDRDGLTVGEEFRVLRPVRPVVHPRTGVPLGWQVKVLGRIRVDCVGEDTSAAAVTLSYDYMREGDLVEPWSSPTLPAERSLAPKLAGPCVPGTDGPGVVILGAEEDKQLLAEGDVIFLDRGLAGGVVPGSRLAVWREGGADGRGVFLVGEVQVLLSRNYTASALVTSSLRPLSREDGLVIW